MQLIGAGVERDEADLCRGGKTFDMPDGSFHFVASRALDCEPAAVFSEAEIVRRIARDPSEDNRLSRLLRSDRGGRLRLVSVLIVGRRAVDPGPHGRAFVEPFPNAK